MDTSGFVVKISQYDKEVISMTKLISMTSDTLKKPLEFENFLEFFKFYLNFFKNSPFLNTYALSC